MASKTTKKSIMEAFPWVIDLGMFPLNKTDEILRFLSHNFYTAGVYGKNAEIYVVNNKTAIVAGNRTFGNIKPSRELVEEYNDPERERDGVLNFVEDALLEAGKI